MAALLLAALAGAGTANADSEPENWINEAEAADSSVASYTAVFHKQQGVAGELLPEETILLKFKKPSSFYMRWIKEPYAGSELIYVEGWNQNRVRQVTRYAGRRLIISQGVENKLLIRLRVYHQTNLLVENYGYEQLDLGARLTAADFDPKNPAYRF